jgi:DNA (cytosine-5)-methyltransferase 1
MIPNLTYYPRASFLPKNTITDGSVALLTLKNGSRLPTEKDLEYYSSKEFEKFYRVARNYGTRSLNIDNNSVFFFGLLKNID